MAAVLLARLRIYSVARLTSAHNLPKLATLLSSALQTWPKITGKRAFVARGPAAAEPGAGKARVRLLPRRLEIPPDQ